MEIFINDKLYRDGIKVVLNQTQYNFFCFIFFGGGLICATTTVITQRVKIHLQYIVRDSMSDKIREDITFSVPSEPDLYPP